MAVDLDTAVPILGRDRELAELAELVGLGGRPRARCVLVAGDAGVGKTRVLAELALRARAEGWRTAVGHCLDFGDSALPYLPFSELFGRLSRDEPELAAGLAERFPALAHLQPGRRLLSGGAYVPEDDLDRGELFAAVHGALEQLAAEQPVLLVVEDVHWADPSTRDLLSYLFGQDLQGPLAVLATYRSDDLHRKHPLRGTVAQWARRPGVDRVVLDPLADTDVARLVRSLLPGPTPESDVHAIVRRAEGNAFFAEELVNAAAGRAALPDDLADLLLLRVDGLDDAAREVVRAASCAGRQVGHRLLAAVVDQDPETLDRSLRSAVEQNVLVLRGADGFGFRHALLAEAVYDDLLPGERVRLHAAYVDALGTGRAEGTAAELARHARLANDLPTALRASVQAGDEAMSVGGPDEAAQHYETALALATEPGLAGEARDVAGGVDRVRLAVRAAEALVAAGQPERAEKLVTAELDAGGGDQPGEDRARLLMALATATLVLDPPRDPLAATTEALALLPDEPTAARARLLGLHARAFMREGDDQSAGRFAMQALGLAQKLDLGHLVADATTTLASVEERSGDPATAERSLEEVVAQAHRTGDVAAELRGRYLLAGLAHERGELDAAYRGYRTGYELARRVGRPWSPYGFEARLMGALSAYELGHWDECLALTTVAGEAPPPLAEALLLGLRAMVTVHRGDDTAPAVLEQVRPLWSRDGLVGISAGAAEIDWYGDRGDVVAVLTTFERAVRVVGALLSEHFHARIRLSALVLGHLADAATGSTAAGRADLAAHAPGLLAGVDGVVQRVRRRRRPFGPEGDAWLARTRAEHLRLRWAADVDPPTAEQLTAAWRETAEAFAGLGHVFETARSQGRLADVLTATGQVPEAREVREAALGTARRLGARPLVERLLRAAGSRDTGGPDPSRLTAREVEILRLVADGLSNSEIGRRLFISAKTVSVHVSNILAKLDAGGRTEAAAIARRRGLL